MGRQNFFATRLTTDIGSSDTTITLETAPSETSGRLVLEARNPTQREVIAYTGLSGTQITGVTRGEGGTTAKTHTRNALVEMNLVAADIDDLYEAFNTFVADNNDWRNLPYSVSGVTALGNRSYEIDVSGVNLTDILSEGMRVRTARTVAASNTSFSLDGTNDYYVKTSPNKMTWTDDFAAGWWVYPTAYVQAGIASRWNGTSGWNLLMLATGQVRLEGTNAGAANFSNVTSYQSLPLNKWTFVSAQLDMSAYTATTTTSYIMINGVDVPAAVIRGGTNPTALVQAGNFEVGSYNGGSAPFPGYIGGGGVFSAKVTQATMLGYMNQPLVGTETNLASGYANGSVNDLNTTTPNNLTATNGATTVANSPYGNRGASTTLDYGIIMAAPTYAAGDTTIIVQVPEGCTIPTSGGVSSVDYSTASVPYGFPRDKGRWRVTYVNGSAVSTTSNATFAVLPGVQFVVPVGAWVIGWQSTIAVTAVINLYFTLSDTSQTGLASNTSDRRLQMNQIGASGAAANSSVPYLTSYRNLSTAATFKMYTLGSTTTGVFVGTTATSELFAENAYL